MITDPGGVARGKLIAREELLSFSFLREALGESFLRGFIAIKSQEWDKFNALVPAIDYDWYLDNV